jgi:ubiquinone/menaquinone biosynthesis C-methylase UbiE
MSSRDDLPGRLARMYDAEAAHYEAMPGHGHGSPEEQEAWRSDVAAAAVFSAGSAVLEVGAGTGAFTQLLAEWGCQVAALDLSAGMLAEVAKHLPANLRSQVAFHEGDTHVASLFPPSSFDWVVARQVVNHLYDPLKAFGNWAMWLRPAGQVAVVEGFWPCEDWAELVDLLPLSSVHTRATVAYLLEHAGFHVEANVWLEQVNAYWAPQASGPPPRYLIRARVAA